MSGAGSVSERTRPRIEAAAALAAVPVAASAIVFLLNTRHGIGVLPDSIGYMQLGATVARYAPLYTWLIEAFSLHEANVVATAKALGLALVCVNSLLIWLLCSWRRSAPRDGAVRPGSRRPLE